MNLAKLHRDLIIDAIEFRIEELERRLAKRISPEMRDLWDRELFSTRCAKREFIAATKEPVT